MGSPRDSLLPIELAPILLEGTWALRGMRERAARRYPENRRLIGALVRKAWNHFGNDRPAEDTLTVFLVNAFLSITHRWQSSPIRAARMKSRWPVPALATAGKIAQWLGLPLARLDWLADRKELTLKQAEQKLRHYVTIRLPRRRGKARLLEAPKGALKAIQRRILHEVVAHIPPHDAAHGFRPRRSIVSFVAPHVGKRIVLRFDLRDFFASVSAARVTAIFRGAGYPEQSACLLAGLCTTRTPDEIPAEPRWRIRHLPQGAPTSPALANLAAYRLDVRLQALAQKLGAAYTRYADDIAFSGDGRLERAAKRVQVLVAVIAAEEGFELHLQKSRFMRVGVRQQLGGVVINARPNLRRDAYDLLKATLYNCLRTGPDLQNRAGHPDFRRHLQGRIAFVKMLHPARGSKLQAAFERIVWPG